MTLLAFHNDPTVKAKYLKRLRLHAKADEIVHGYYWDRGKGCAVGCTIHSRVHANYEKELGIPIMLARLEDRIFEGLENGESKEFPVQFLSAIRVGADLSCVGWKFLHWLLTEELVGRDDPRVASTITQCANVLIPLMKGERCDIVEAVAAKKEAAYAAYAAADASATASAAAYAAADASATAADTAATAASAAATAASAAAYAADAAAYAAADASYARQKAYSNMAKKLIELIRKVGIYHPVTRRRRAPST